MEILELMRDDHSDSLLVVQQLAELAEREDAEAAAELLLVRLSESIFLHARSEECAFYEVCKRRGDKLRECVSQSSQEHQTIDHLLSALRATKPGPDGEFSGLLGVLRDLLEGHTAREEQELFPVLLSAFNVDERDMLGHMMLAEQVRLLGAGRSPDGLEELERS